MSARPAPTETLYPRFSPGEFARRYAAARAMMAREITQDGCECLQKTRVRYFVTH